MTTFLRSLVSVSALVLSISVASAQDAVIKVDTAPTGITIPAELYGQFSEHLGSCIYGGIWVGKDSAIPNISGYRKDVVDALKALKVPVLRWPGGCFADDYHWMDGIGPLEGRARISNNNWGGDLEDNSFGTHEFLDLCELIGCEPYISGNVGSGTPEELAKWVEYMNSDSQSTVANMRRKNGRDKAWNVKYLGIGNEAWGCGGNMTPEYYSDLFKRYTTYTRNFNGRLYTIASGASDWDFNWTEVLMKRIGSKMNALAVHYYTVPKDWTVHGSATEFSDDEYLTTLGKAVAIDKIVEGHIAIMDKYDPEHKVDLLVDEWGAWYDVEPGTNPGHLFQQSTMRDALVASLSLNIFHKYSERVKMANIAQVVNVLQSMILTQDDKMVLTPTYHVFQMYNVHQNAALLNVSFSKKPLQKTSNGDIPVIDATASSKDGLVNVTLCNTDLIGTKKASVDLGGKYTVVEAKVLGSKDIHDVNTFDKPETVRQTSFKDYKVTSTGVDVTLPAHSVVNITLKAKM